MDLLTGIFSAFGLSASAGLNAYIPLLVIGVIDHYTDLLTLQKPWDTLSNPWILILLGILLIVEMLADKIPAVNHINDAIQTVVRPAAGAVAFAASANVITDVNPVLALALVARAQERAQRYGERFAPPALLSKHAEQDQPL